ncbi:hypothetical protein Lal_00033714 [Lupinus albus]|nr:hypothetical protein Lal_00033714 [Lupinus albus]
MGCNSPRHLTILNRPLRKAKHLSFMSCVEQLESHKKNMKNKSRKATEWLLDQPLLRLNQQSLFSLNEQMKLYMRHERDSNPYREDTPTMNLMNWQ